MPRDTDDLQAEMIAPLEAAAVVESRRKRKRTPTPTLFWIAGPAVRACESG